MKRAPILFLALLALGCGGPLYDGSGPESPNHGCSATGCPIELLAEGQSPSAGGLALSGKWLAWANVGGTVMALARDGTPPVKQLASGWNGTSGQSEARLTATADGRLYWLNFTRGLVMTYREDLDLADAAVSLTSVIPYYPPLLKTAGNKLFWFDGLRLVEYDLATHQSRDVTQVTGGPMALAVDDRFAYWSEQIDPSNASSAFNLNRVDLATGEVTLLASTTSYPDSLAVDPAFLYVSLHRGAIDGGEVARIPLSGGALETLVQTRFWYGEELALDDQYVYFTNCNLSGPVGNMDVTDGLVERIPKAGGAPQILAQHQLRPGAIAVDDNAVYWATFDGKIERALKP